MKISKKYMAVMIVIIMAFSVLPVYGQNEQENEVSTFDDVPTWHYAYEYINMMVELGILDGYGDGSFGIDDPVNKEQFAKMMVLTLGMELMSPNAQTFRDVAPGDWSYSFVETAKYYMTFWSNTYGYFFKPAEEAVREDMAVAIVKALNIDVSSTDMSVLDTYTDANSISSNLRRYVAAAINEGIMIGDGAGHFMAQSDITRGDTATLLGRLIINDIIESPEEKMTFDELYEDGEAPVLIATTLSNKVNLLWTPGRTDGLSGYKVVVSTTDSTPVYPDQGYITYTNSLTYELYDSQHWNNGESNELQGGQDYFVAITALYDDGTKISSNTELVTLPNTGSLIDEEINMIYQLIGDKVALFWEEAQAPISYYKVVMSKDEAEPMYPDDGYLFVLQDEYAVIEAGEVYNGGGVGTVEANETYYVAITVVYSDGSKVSSNVEEITIPDNGYESTAQRSTMLRANATSGGILLTWDDVDSPINYYKVVLSVGDSTPSYPDNGWLVYQDETSFLVSAGQSYSGGDVGTVSRNKTYYAAITVVYSNGTKVTSNVVEITIP